MSKTAKTPLPDKVTDNMQRAVIYARVSSVKQKVGATGLQSQEHRCRDYAMQRGYQVDAVFEDDVSGGGDFMKRPGMAALLEYVQRRPEHRYVVVFDDLKRFARDTAFHIKLKQTLISANASIECLNFKMEDSPEGTFIETVIAAQGQLEREQNRRQTIQKMKARVERGYHVFQPMPGYTFEKVPGHGKILVRDEPLASIITECLKGYASGRFGLQVEVKRFLLNHPEFPAKRKKTLTNQTVNDMLTHPTYAGLVEAPNWGVQRRQGHHEGLISVATYQAIQKRLAGPVVAPERKTHDERFILRGSVCCADCGKPLTASMARSRHGYQIPYYHCFNKKGGCPSYGKSIRREKLEGEFEELLQRLTPSQALIATAKAMFKDLWALREKSTQARRQRLEQKVSKLAQQSEALIERIADTTNAVVVKAYEKKLNALAQETLELEEAALKTTRPANTFEDALQTPMQFLQNPWHLWRSERKEDKQLVLKLVFGGRLSYQRGVGFSNPELSLPFRVLGGDSGGGMPPNLIWRPEEDSNL